MLFVGARLFSVPPFFFGRRERMCMVGKAGKASGGALPYFGSWPMSFVVEFFAGWG